MTIDKEAVYDEKVSPLVSQIIEICKQEKIPFIMSFALREESEEVGDLYCTTAIYGQPGMMKTSTFPKAMKVIKSEPEFLGVMIQKGGYDADRC